MRGYSYGVSGSTMGYRRVWATFVLGLPNACSLTGEHNGAYTQRRHKRASSDAILSDANSHGSSGGECGSFVVMRDDGWRAREETKEVPAST